MPLNLAFRTKRKRQINRCDPPFSSSESAVIMPRIPSARCQLYTKNIPFAHVGPSVNISIFLTFVPLLYYERASEEIFVAFHHESK